MAPQDSMDLFAGMQKTAKETHVYTVSEITRDIKLLLEDTFTQVWVEGEISGFSIHPSGHAYFTLKDSASILPAVLFVRVARDIKFKIENGLKVICFGKISAYAAHAGGGKYQIIIEKIEPKGIGSLQLALEQLKEKLEKAGLFSIQHKKPIPYLPSRIGVVTSTSGAAIKDILKVLNTRFKDIEIIISPVRVQGEGAKEEIAQAIRDFNEFNAQSDKNEQIEVMIVGRGGGSIEDLWAFNEEIVAQAIYDSRIPVISAVGHERDWTIADLVADRRAPTPSVAAELVIPKQDELKEKLDGLAKDLKKYLSDMATSLQEAADDFAHRLDLIMEHAVELNSNQLDAATKRLALLNPAFLIKQYRIRILDLARQIYVQSAQFVKLRESGFNTAVEKLSSLNPLNILLRGYSVTFKLPSGQIIKDIKDLAAKDLVKTKLSKGEFLSQVTEVLWPK